MSEAEARLTRYKNHCNIRNATTIFSFYDANL